MLRTTFLRRIRNSIQGLNAVDIPRDKDKPFADAVFHCARVVANMGASSIWITRNSRKHVLQASLPDTAALTVAVPEVDIAPTAISLQRPEVRNNDPECACCTSGEEIESADVRTGNQTVRNQTVHKKTVRKKKDNV